MGPSDIGFCLFICMTLK